MTVDACDADKEVYVKKALTHDLREGAAVSAVQNSNKRIVQRGTQQRSTPHLQEAREICVPVKLGRFTNSDVVESKYRALDTAESNVDPATVRWKQFLGDAPDQPFNEYRMR